MSTECTIIDTTLREGEQTAGVVFSLKQKKQIIDALVLAGIEEVEVGVAAPMAHGVAELVQYCRGKHPSLVISLWSRCREEDIRHGAGLRPDILSISVPASDIHHRSKFQASRNWVTERMVSSVELAVELGGKVAVGFEDATRADSAFLTELAKAAESAGAGRIRLADTVGIASPGKIRDMVSAVCETLVTSDVGIHTHNDFGMATANAIAAFEAGAVWIDGTVLGLGERAGCARLEEVAGYLSLVQGEHRFDLTVLRDLAYCVAGLSGRRIPGNQPLFGADIFACETGLHLQGLLADPSTYEPYSPDKVGAARRWLFGEKSGRSAITQRLRQAGSPSARRRVPEAALLKLKQKAKLLRRPLSEHEMISLLG